MLYYWSYLARVLGQEVKELQQTTYRINSNAQRYHNDMGNSSPYSLK
jgi:hypothetical protein